jgi:hypothetical protein
MTNAPTQHLPAQVRPSEGPPPGPPHNPGPVFGTDPGVTHYRAAATAPPAAPRSRANTAVAVLAAVSVLATVVGLSVNENGRNAWDTVNAWGALAIAGAVLTFAPAIRSSLNLTAHRAWQVAACGAAALALFWVLFVLPAAGSNTSLLVTVGVGAGIIAAWVAPGRDTGAPPSGGPAW